MSRAKTAAKRPPRRGQQASAAWRQSSTSSRKWSVVGCVALVVVTIAVYFPALAHSFLVFDDSDYVTANPHIHHGLAWTTVQWSFTTSAAANWHPLTWLSHALDYQLFGLHAAGHHFDSVLLHALNAVLLFLLLRWMTGRGGASFVVAALFALHPINVESVAWVAERKNVLSTLFFVLAIGAYVRYAQKPGWQRYLPVMAWFAAGLMAKPMVITLPFVLFLLDYWPLGRMANSPPSAMRLPRTAASKLLLEKVPLLALSAVSAVITMKVQRSGYAVRTLAQFPLGVRIENALASYILYLWKMVWPAQLALYPHAGTAPAAWQWLAAALFLIGLTALVIRFRQRGYLPVGWFWFLGTLVPVLGLVQVGQGAMADRYAYLPLVGIFLTIAFGLDDLADAKHVAFAWRAVPVACALIALSAVTYRQIRYWANDYVLWAHTLSVAENPFAHDAMGSALLDPGMEIPADEDSAQNRMVAARQHFERALEMRRQLAPQNPAAYWPDMATTLNNLGNLERMENHTDDARRDYQEALQIQRQLAAQSLRPFPPDEAVTLNNLGQLEKDSGQFEAADEHFRQALEIYRQMAQQNPDVYLPKVADTLNNLALVAREQQRMDEARRDYEEALQLRRELVKLDADAYLPYLAITLNDLGVLDARQNQTADAQRNYAEALQLYRQLARREPEVYTAYLAATLNNLAMLEESQDRWHESRAYYEEGLDLFRKLYEADPRRYSGDVARVEASLAQLDKKASAQ